MSKPSMGYDVIIIGAGLAGLRLAQCLCKTELNWLLLERKPSAKALPLVVRRRGEALAGTGRLRFSTDVMGTDFDPNNGWRLACDNQQYFRAAALVVTSHSLAQTMAPPLLGWDKFQGAKTQLAEVGALGPYHNRRLAIIGNEAVALLPDLVGLVQSVKLFQPRPNWVLPEPRFSASDVTGVVTLIPPIRHGIDAARYRLGRLLQRDLWRRGLQNIARNHLRHAVADSWLRRQLTPLAKDKDTQVIFNNEYLAALQQGRCKLITWPVIRLSEQGVRTVEGIEHQVDCIIDASLSERFTQLGAEYDHRLLLLIKPLSAPAYNSLLNSFDMAMARLVRQLLDIKQRTSMQTGEAHVA